MNLIPIRVWRPDNDDPPGIDDFYRALGHYMVAWGRLDGQVMGILQVITVLLWDKLPNKQLPIAWKWRERRWKEGFGQLTELKPFQQLAMDLFYEIQSRSEERNFLAHATWGHFVSSEPLTMEAVSFKSEKGSETEMALAHAHVSLHRLDASTAYINEIALQLAPISLAVCSLRPPPEKSRKFWLQDRDR
jgi:hypothetical protein